MARNVMNGWTIMNTRAHIFTSISETWQYSWTCWLMGDRDCTIRLFATPDMQKIRVLKYR